MSGLRLSWRFAAVLLLLGACGPRELILEGERLDIRAALDAGDVVEDPELPGTPPGFVPPPTALNGSWTHQRATAEQSIPHPALGSNLTRIWSVNIGEGNGRKHRITAVPVVSDGRIFTLDSRARLSAVSTTGTLLWSRDLTPASDNADDASGGGLAVEAGRVFATTAFGRLSAHDAGTGEILWEQDLNAVASGAPTVRNGRVFLTTRDGRGWAIDAAGGRVLWTVRSPETAAAVSGAPAPAVSDTLAVFSFASGEVIGVIPDSGTRVWTAYLLGARLERVYGRIADITADPVLAGRRVYVGTHSGESAAIEAGTGQTVWLAEEGAMSPVWVAGGSVFQVSDLSELLRLDAATGEVLWRTQLPYFTRERERRRKQIFAHFGPVLAGGRLLVASDDELIRSFDPSNGALIGTVDLPGGAAADPVVAAGTLYVVTKSGQLSAFR